MKNRILVLFASSILALPMLVQAVGMGSIKVYSHLNERLKAEIPILSVNSSNKGRVTVALGTNVEFEKRGVERSDILNDLSFSVLEKSNGRMYVEVSSSKQIVEPYLNFILTLNDGEGMVSREFAVFLDPAKPSFAGNASTPPKSDSATKRSASSSQVKPKAATTAPKTVKKAAPPASKWQIETEKGGSYGPVRKKETLWSIAKHTRPSEAIPVRDMMNLIMRANPNIFPSYQPQKMPSGVTLNIPKIKGYESYAGGYAPMPGGVQVAEKKTSAKKVEDNKSTTSKDSPKRPKATPSVTTDTDKTVVSSETTPQVAQTNAQTTQADTQEVPATTSQTAQTGAAASSTDTNISEIVANSVGTAVEATTETAKSVADGATDALDAAKEGAETIIDNTKEAASDLTESAGAVVDSAVGEIKDAKDAVVSETNAAIDTAKEQLSMDIPSADTEQQQALEAAKQNETQVQNQPVATNQTSAAQNTAESQLTTEEKAAEEAKKKAAEARKAALRTEPAKPQPSFIEENMPYLLGGGGVVALLAALLGYNVLRRKKAGSEKNEVVLLDEDDLEDEEELESAVEEVKSPAKQAITKASIDDELEEDLSDLEDLDDDFDLDLGTDDDIDDLDKLLGTVSNSSNTTVDDELGADLDKLLEAEPQIDVKSRAEKALEKAADKVEKVESNDFSLDFSLDDEPEVSIVSPAKREDLANAAVEEVEFDISEEEQVAKVEKAEAAAKEKEQQSLAEAIAKRQLSDEEISRVQMKLDLANSFASIAENKRAKDLIEEVISEGSADQVAEAKKLLEQLDT